MAQTYEQAVDKNRRALAQARLADQNEHFPYKIEAVRELLSNDPPMGPGTPDDDGGGVDGASDTSRKVSDYITADIAEASRDYVEAQAAYLSEGTPESLDAYEAARDRLVAARLDHRRNRGKGFTVGAAARKAG